MNKRTIALSLLLAVPLISFAQTDSGLIKCGIKDEVTGLIPHPCEYNDLVALVQTVINYLIYTIATPIAAVMFGVAGFQMITSGGDPGKVKSAKKIFTNVLIGYAVMLAAFLIIKLIMSFLFPEEYYSTTLG